MLVISLKSTGQRNPLPNLLEAGMRLLDEITASDKKLFFDAKLRLKKEQDNIEVTVDGTSSLSMAIRKIGSR